MSDLTENKDTERLQYAHADLTQPLKTEINTKSQVTTGRTVVTTQTRGSIALRYAPKQPK